MFQRMIVSQLLQYQQLFQKKREGIISGGLVLCLSICVIQHRFASFDDGVHILGCFESFLQVK